MCVLGGGGLTMVEVNGVMDQLHRQCQGVPLMMGAATHVQAADALLVGLLVAHPDDSEEAPAAPEPAVQAQSGIDPRPTLAPFGVR